MSKHTNFLRRMAGIENKDESVLIFGIAFWMGVGGLISLIVFPIILISNGINYRSNDIDPQTTGAVGDFIGGFVGSIWAFAGVLLFFAALRLQRKEFRLQRDEFVGQKNEFKVNRITNVIYNQIGVIAGVAQDIRIESSSTTEEYLQGDQAVRWVVKNGSYVRLKEAIGLHHEYLEMVSIAVPATHPLLRTVSRSLRIGEHLVAMASGDKNPISKEEARILLFLLHSNIITEQVSELVDIAVFFNQRQTPDESMTTCLNALKEYKADETRNTSDTIHSKV